CHAKKVGGAEEGNHPVNVSAKKKSNTIMGVGGKYGESMANQVICESCHMAHGGLNKNFLVMPAEVSSRASLCVTCHGESPSLSKRRVPRRGSHPVNVSPEKSSIPAAWSDGRVATVGQHGEIVCRTCHSPHGAVASKKLLAERNDKDSMCIACHPQKRFIAGSRHDLKNFEPNEKNINGRRAADLGPCSSCHLVHDGAGKFMWARKESINQRPGQYCIGCHSAEGVGEKVLPKDFTHPMDSGPASMQFAPAIMKIRCATCHDLHNPLPLHDAPDADGKKRGKFLLHSEQGPAGVCLSCHPRYGLVRGTDHDLRITAPDFKNAGGQTAEQGGLCSPCHGAHGAGIQKSLWAAPLGPALIDGWSPEHSEGNEIMTKLCTGCHSTGGAAEKKIPEAGLHPMGLRAPEKKSAGEQPAITFEQIKDAFPVFTHTGEVAGCGNIVCSTCHNPHQWNPDSEKAGPGKNVDGDASNSFLRPNLYEKLCTECHGEDWRETFENFHSADSRRKAADALSGK
ncbi:cytochrome c3 family protein, partial [Thermodesulfobacteriota bacterium]